MDNLSKLDTRADKEKPVETMSSTEQAVERFHLARMTFAFTKDMFYFVKNDKRSHKEWLKDLHGEEFTEELYNKTSMGYFLEMDWEIRCVIYVGSDYVSYTPTRDEIDMLYLIYVNHFKSNKPIFIYTGVEIGNPGELWEPTGCINHQQHIDILSYLQEHSMVSYNLTCKDCESFDFAVITQEDFRTWRLGQKIDTRFHYLPKDIKNWFKTGLCPRCYLKAEKLSQSAEVCKDNLANSENFEGNEEDSSEDKEKDESDCQGDCDECPVTDCESHPKFCNGICAACDRLHYCEGCFMNPPSL